MRRLLAFPRRAARRGLGGAVHPPLGRWLRGAHWQSLLRHRRLLSTAAHHRQARGAGESSESSSWVACSLLAADAQDAVGRFTDDGVVVFSERVAPAYLERARGLVEAGFADAIARAGDINRARGRLSVGEEPGEQVREAHGCGIGQCAGFRELIQRAPGRFDFQWGLEELNDLALDPAGVLPHIDAFARRVLGPDAKLEFSGCLLSFPGGAEQLWHADGEHLFNERGSPATHDAGSGGANVLPVHCLNMFIPLVDVASQNGGTEFCLGSHRQTQKVRGSDVVWQREHWRDTIGADDASKLVRVQVEAGQILSFDYRVLHRALAHQDTAPRPVLYFTYCKPWYTDALNFAGLPSLADRDAIVASAGGASGGRVGRDAGGAPLNVGAIRAQYPTLQRAAAAGVAVYADGAAGTQTPAAVVRAIADYLTDCGATNVGGSYRTAEKALRTVRAARVAGAEFLLGYEGTADAGGVEEEPFTRRISFGLNCSNLLFHLSRSLLLGQGFSSLGGNVVVSGACHDANIGPWTTLANRANLEVRWLRPESDAGDAGSDSLAHAEGQLSRLIDAETRVVALGLASNATGRVHEGFARAVARRVAELKAGKAGNGPLLVLDATHYVPHRALNIDDAEAWSGAVDAVVCSSYKFAGPHLGVMAFGSSSPLGRPGSDSDGFPCWKVGLRFSDPADRGGSDILPVGLPTHASYEVSRWEMGTLPYESLAGFSALVQDYYKDAALFGGGGLRASFERISAHEHQLCSEFLDGFADLERSFGASGLEPRACPLRLHGSRDPRERTTTFAVSVDQGGSVGPLCEWLNRERGVHCTHGNHYAPELVDGSPGLGQAPAEGVVRLSFVHYNSLDDVQAVLAALREWCERPTR